MKIISWNINSLRLRLPLLKKLAQQANPDIICLQETKVNDPDFPLLEIKALGFDFVEFSGEKSYNGVAILSKFPISNATTIDIGNCIVPQSNLQLKTIKLYLISLKKNNILSSKLQEILWDKFYTSAPEPRKKSDMKFKTLKRVSLR